MNLQHILYYKFLYKIMSHTFKYFFNKKLFNI